MPAPKIAALLEPNFVEARLHTDHADAEKGDANRKLQMKLVGFIASPVYVAIDPVTEHKLGKFQLPGSDWENAFAEFLQEALKARPR